MIDKDTLLKLAEKAIVDAPNNSWRNRGSIKIDGEIRSSEIKTWEDKKLGWATVAFIKFEHPEKDDGFHNSKEYAFAGFMLAAMEVGQKVITSVEPVIGKLKDHDYNRNNLSHRFCPQCHSLDSVKSKTRHIRSELCEVTYRCNKCSYIDHDMID